MFAVLKNTARAVVKDDAQRDALRKSALPLLTRLYEHDLTRLAQLFGSDKADDHDYTPHYARHFQPLRKRRMNVLEIGVGGYDDPQAGGASLRMWKRYFPNSNIFALDIHDKSPHEEDRIRIFRGSQNDPEFLGKIVDEIGQLDIVIDDGSHVNEHILTSFHTLWPRLAPDGIYAIEDLETAYWPEYGGDSYNLDMADTSINFLKKRIDGLHHKENAAKSFVPGPYDAEITQLHFYRGLCFLYKGVNDRPAKYRHHHVY
ncbi:MAG: class I SAM-dependent methyltransferase [Pseudomonadota bacterium]